MMMAEYRLKAKPPGGARLRDVWLGLLLTSPLLGACVGGDGGWQAQVPAVHPAPAYAARGAHRRCDGRVCGSVAPSNAAATSEWPVEVATPEIPALAPLAAGELPAVTVEARPLGRCPQLGDRRAVRALAPADSSC